MASEEQHKFIEIMSPMYIAGRYPEYKNQVARMLNEKGSTYLIEQTKQFKQWILQKRSEWPFSVPLPVRHPVEDVIV